MALLEKGDFAYPLDLRGTDEVSTLTAAFQRMRQALQETQRKEAAKPAEPPKQEVLLAASETWDKLPKTVAAARDKVVFAYAYDKVNRVEIESAAGSVKLARDGINWNITAPEALKADTGAVNGLLWRIRDLRASAQALGRRETLRALDTSIQEIRDVADALRLDPDRG